MAFHAIILPREPRELPFSVLARLAPWPAAMASSSRQLAGEVPEQRTHPERPHERQRRDRARAPAGRTSSSPPAAIIGVEARVDAPHEFVPLDRDDQRHGLGDSSTGLPGRRCHRPATDRSPPAPPARARCAADRSACRRAGHLGIARASTACSGAAPVAAASRASGRARRRDRAAPATALRQRLEVEPGAADDDRARGPRVRASSRRAPRRPRSGRPNSSRAADEAVERMRHARLVLRPAARSGCAARDRPACSRH